VTYPVVKITWEDHCSSDSAEWENLETMLEELKASEHIIENVGFLLHQDATHLYVAGCWDKTGGHVGETYKIIRTTVKNIEFL
jgi:hypothetical protein